MVTIGTQGAIDVAAAIVGNWSDVDFVKPNSGAVWDGLFDVWHIGNFEEAVLELSREDYTHIGTALPQIADYVVPIRSGMKFSGQATEFHRALLHALVGDDIAATSSYIYPGTQTCNTFFTLRAMRKRACDGVVIETRLFKVRAQGAIQIGSATEGVRTPVELEALDDSANSMQQGASTSAPLGWIWMPTEGASVAQTNVAI
jgi:hypothetical protein